MSTATIAAGNNVRPFAAIKADMANALANKPESLLADAKAALTWLPAKAYNAAVSALRWLHVPQALSFIRVNFTKFLGVVGKGPFAVEMLTSHWGQKTIVKGLTYGGKVVGFGMKWSWKILTSPLRLFSPTRSGVEKAEAVIAKVNDKLTPNSGETFGPLQIARDILGYNLSADRAPIKFARITAVAVMAVRTTRRFAPAGWMRIAAYILDGLIIGRAYDNALADTWLGKKITGLGDRVNRKAAVIEADIVSAGENASAEATRLTRDAASKSAAKLRQQAAEIEAEGLRTAEQLSSDLVTETAENAKELREQASSLEATAERMEASATAAAATGAAQEAATAVLEAERPKPGPSVPPMGGRTPSNGPEQGKRHQGGGKPSRR